MILLDTNLPIRMTRSRDPQAGVARAAVQSLLGRGERLIVVPQNLYEFWAPATRPPGAPDAGRNGMGMTPGQAGQWPRVLDADGVEAICKRRAFKPGLPELACRRIG